MPCRASWNDPSPDTNKTTTIPATMATVPWTDPLGLGVGEFYSRLVTGMLTTASGRAAAKGDVVVANGGTPSAGRGVVPTFSALQPWLEKIKDPALACMTAQRVAAGMTRCAGV